MATEFPGVKQYEDGDVSKVHDSLVGRVVTNVRTEGPAGFAIEFDGGAQVLKIGFEVDLTLMVESRPEEPIPDLQVTGGLRTAGAGKARGSLTVIKSTGEVDAT